MIEDYQTLHCFLSIIEYPEDEDLDESIASSPARKKKKSEDTDPSEDRINGESLDDASSIASPSKKHKKKSKDKTDDGNETVDTMIVKSEATSDNVETDDTSAKKSKKKKKSKHKERDDD